MGHLTKTKKCRYITKTKLSDHHHYHHGNLYIHFISPNRGSENYRGSAAPYRITVFETQTKPLSAQRLNTKIYTVYIYYYIIFEHLFIINSLLIINIVYNKLVIVILLLRYFRVFFV